jgi:Arc/MetJ-type ribon-helix-helix transcriptional regulator
MEFELSDKDELIIQRFLETGAYADHADVLDAALMTLERHPKQDILDNAIQQGLNSGIDEDFSWADLKAEAKASVGKT